MFSALTENHGDIRDKLHIFVALAPVVHPIKTKFTQVKELAGFWNPLNEVVHGIFDFNEMYDPSISVMSPVCNIVPSICDVLAPMLNVISKYQDHTRALTAALRKRDNATSWKTLVHFA